MAPVARPEESIEALYKPSVTVRGPLDKVPVVLRFSFPKEIAPEAEVIEPAARVRSESIETVDANVAALLFVIVSASPKMPVSRVLKIMPPPLVPFLNPAI